MQTHQGGLPAARYGSLSDVSTRRVTLDANEAVASVAHRTNEVIAIYPITPSSPMGELSDAWSAKGRANIWGKVPDVVEMQSEGGAAGAVHGALQAGALATTFTASQGLLLMIPNMYKIAGELTPFTMHVAARTLATHALSIFGDHSDVMACRATGFAMLAAGSVQEAQDFAAIAQTATLASRIPFLHFFDGFRTSHEIAKIEELSDEELLALIDEAGVAAHRAARAHAGSPRAARHRAEPRRFLPGARGGESLLPRLPGHRGDMRWSASPGSPGARYSLFDYVGHPEAERVIVLMGSGAETAHETVEWLVARGEKVGVLKVRLYRPFDVARFVAALPPTVRAIAVLDRTKEPGAIGEPLYQDVVTAFAETRDGAAGPRIVGGRYGLSSKEFTPAMVDGSLRGALAASARATTSRSASSTTSRTRRFAFDADLDIEPRRRHAGGLLRPRFRRHGRRQQELDQDHGRGDRRVRPGLLRLRLEEGGRRHDLAPALRAAARSARLISCAAPVSSPATSSSSSTATTCSRRPRGRGVPAQLALRPRRGLGRAPAGDAGADRPEEAALLRRRRLSGSRGRRA